VRRLVRRWVVGCAGAKALPRLQLLTALSGVRSVFMDGLNGLGGQGVHGRGVRHLSGQRRLATSACSLVNASTAVAMLAGGWPWLFWSCWLECGWISVWRCPSRWHLRADAINAKGDAVLGFLDDSRPADELVAGIPVRA